MPQIQDFLNMNYCQTRQIILKIVIREVWYSTVFSIVASGLSWVNGNNKGLFEYTDMGKIDKVIQLGTLY